MKNISVAVLIGLTLFASCGKKHEPMPVTAVTVFIDRTGDALALPNPASIEEIYSLRKRTERGGIFTLQSVTDLQYAPSISFEIEPQSFVMQDPLKRRKEINDFLSKISLALAQTSLQPVGKQRSQIYAPLIQYLNALAAFDADEKVAIAMSDLGENEEIFSVYNDADLRQVLDKPDDILKKLSHKYGELHDMRGVTVEFRYSAVDYKDGQRYALMSSLFRKLIESKGGKVLVTGGSITENKGGHGTH